MRLTNARSRYAGHVISMAVAASLSGVAYAGPGVWTSGGPYGGYVSTLAVNPKSPSTLYAGGYGDGVFESTDAGGTWVTANTGLTNLNVLPLAISPVNPSTLSVGTDG